MQKLVAGVGNKKLQIALGPTRFIRSEIILRYLEVPIIKEFKSKKTLFFYTQDQGSLN